MNILKQWLDRQKAENRKRKQKEVIDTFKVREDGMTLFIEHSGDALKYFPITATIAEIKEALIEFRSTALKYHGLYDYD